MTPIAIALAQFAPLIAGWLAGPKAEAVADKVVEIAQVASGQPTPDAALRAIQADPNLAMQFQQAVMNHQAELERIAMQREANELGADTEGAKLTTERAALLEGTTSDLKAMPLLGPLMLFARGAQRPLIGYGTIYLDYMVFSGMWKLAEGVQQNCFFLINLLVLGFLFGERAVKNVAPLIAQVLAARAKV